MATVSLAVAVAPTTASLTFDALFRCQSRLRIDLEDRYITEAVVICAFKDSAGVCELKQKESEPGKINPKVRI